MLRVICLALLVQYSLAQDCDKTFEECLAIDAGVCKELTEARGLGVDCIQVHKFIGKCKCTCDLLNECGKDPTATTTAAPTQPTTAATDATDAPTQKVEGGESAPPPEETECFHGDGVVTTELGPMKIKDLAQTSGITVQGVNRNGDIEMADLQLWLDKVPEALQKFLKIETESGHVLHMTHEHLAHVVPCSGGAHQAKFARRLSAGECVLVEKNGALEPSKISAVTAVQKRGYFAFVTSTDGVIVDGVVASTFTTIENEKLQRIWFNGVQRLVNLLPTPVQDFCYWAFENPAKFTFVSSQF